MTNETQKQRKEGTYTYIYSGVERLSSEVWETAGTRGFEEYIQRVNGLQRKYIQEFHQMDTDERADASLLINMVTNQIHGSLDVLRAKAMRGALKPRKTR